MELRSQFITIDNVKLHLADWGGQGPTLFLLHANGFLGRIYRAMIHPLLTHYHVVTMDLRGQGDSETSELGPDHWQKMAQEPLKALSSISGCGISTALGILAVVLYSRYIQRHIPAT